MVSAAKYARAERELKPARVYGTGALGERRLLHCVMREQKRKAFMVVIKCLDFFNLLVAFSKRICISRPVSPWVFFISHLWKVIFKSSNVKFVMISEYFFNFMWLFLLVIKTPQLRISGLPFSVNGIVSYLCSISSYCQTFLQILGLRTLPMQWTCTVNLTN